MYVDEHVCTVYIYPIGDVLYVGVCSDLLEAYSKCSDGSEVVAVQEKWLEEAHRERDSQRESKCSFNWGFVGFRYFYSPFVSYLRLFWFQVGLFLYS